MALAYLLSVLTALVVLAVAMRPRRTPAPVPPAPAPAPAVAVAPGAEVRVILAAAHQLAARLSTAA
ncbi:hypothetical protein [Streptomyces sp. NPDC093808]|uniref:hypothetical protein n=1 Tax=Streptomyces sp. NPDC093808 TaxID=3154985 RepID=UPI00344C3132